MDCINCRILLIIFLGLTLAAFIWIFTRSEENLPVPDSQVIEQQITIPTATVNGNVIWLEIARTREEQARGLSGRESLTENTGMLFVYDQQATPGFWMPGMNFSIDIMWIDGNKKIIGITENVSPETFPEIFSPPSPVLYVLEVNAGWSQTYGIVPGDEITLDL